MRDTPPAEQQLRSSQRSNPKDVRAETQRTRAQNPHSHYSVNLIELQSIINKTIEMPIALAWFYADRDVVFSMYPKYDENLLFVQVPVNDSL